MRKLLLIFILSFSQLYFSQSDCISAIPVCGNSNISYTPLNSGTIQEDLMGCLASDEHFSVWYSFTIATSGTLTFEITPNVYADDYDFGVYGPNQTCGALSPPIRCNYSGLDGPTGLSLALTGTQTNGTYSAYMDVVAGETYYLVVDNWTHTINGFSLTWGGTATLTSAFSDPTITPNPFITPGTPGPTPTSPNEIMKCALPTMFDFNTLTADILNGNQNFELSYHTTTNDAITGANPITAPILVNSTTTYYYRVEYTDPANPQNPINGCFQTGAFKFREGNIVAQDATIYACNNNNVGTGTFDLTSAAVYPGANLIKKYYPTLNDLNAGTNEITNPSAYVSAEKKVYVKTTTTDGCSDDAEITLQFFPLVIVKDASLESCYIESNITTASFDLTSADVTSITGATKKFYTTLANATNGTNEILNPNNYITTTGTVYVKVISSEGCFAISKIDLKVLPPVKSTILKDKTICIEDTTTLDAGPGFDGYEWSTGATTQSIGHVSVGTYWVKLKTGKCYTLQTVTVYASEQPVISSLDISNNTITVNANGGKPPYKYSLDGINWQDSNVFTGLPRGENKIFVKDSYNCQPINVQITVPNLVNAITPNGDNVNDVLDYSALAYKKDLVFTIYDRYGNKLYEANKMRNYSWDGTASGKKIITGTYWYTITWTENDKNNTQTKYSGWILVKNKD
ncbi:gliding motility-associated C-terminal domain-containing protein [Chryseobacterium oryctis]|uniref:Gliding motility-associated C-terminal domain-containing protein n=1 Tax=Chryseobacterium oryctis TaxID=2952618 RepID=A0ABT3HKW8_9FLAO|nr:gliding motility-associated C-terminal domain-containing protein [Chryseobacterium oryctis]MCW3160432.1 gliding motility-associated C-terminal domain-containing protein [Chryseobacterium oryctis]